MDKRFSWIFLLVSGAFFVFIVGLTGYRIENARRVNAAAARERLPEITSMVRSLRDSTGSYDAPLFKSDLRGMFEAESRLLLLSLHSPESGIVYLVSRNHGFLREPAAITSDWRGTPSYRVSRGYEMLLSAPLSDAALSDAGQELTLDAMFVVLGREDLYAVVRDDLFLFLAFLLVCGVVILITTSIQQDALALGWLPDRLAATDPCNGRGNGRGPGRGACRRNSGAGRRARAHVTANRPRVGGVPGAAPARGARARGVGRPRAFDRAPAH
jgi:hypothetical protein